MKFVVVTAKGMSLVEARNAKEAARASTEVLQVIPYTKKVKKVSDIEIAHVAMDLAMMLKSGVDTALALDSVAQGKEPNTMLVMFHVKHYISHGESIAEAFRHTGAFPELFVNALKAGSERGKVEEVLNMLANYYRRKGGLKGKMGTAMIMPDATLITAFGAALYMIKSLFPQLRKFAYDAGVRHFSSFTALFMWMSDHFYLTAGIAILILFLYFYKKNVILEHTPKVGGAFKSLMEHLNIYLISSIAGVVLSTGMQVTDALKYATNGVTDKRLKLGLQNAVQAIEKGSSVTSAFSRERSIPSALRSVAVVGEKTGKLSEALVKLSESMDENIANDIKVIESVMPIAMVFLVAPIVFLVLLSFYGSYFFIIAQIMGHIVK